MSYNLFAQKMYGTVFYDLSIHGCTEEELRKSFESAMEAFKPKLNKLQEHLYGQRVYNFTPEILKGIVDNKRGTGKTTAQAMKQIAEAIQNPGKEIKLVDDDGRDSGAGLAGKQYRDVVQEIITKLDLKFMVIKQTQHTLKFDI